MKEKQIFAGNGLEVQRKGKVFTVFKSARRSEVTDMIIVKGRRTNQEGNATPHCIIQCGVAVVIIRHLERYIKRHMLAHRKVPSKEAITAKP